MSIVGIAILLTWRHDFYVMNAFIRGVTSWFMDLDYCGLVRIKAYGCRDGLHMVVHRDVHLCRAQVSGNRIVL